MMELWNDFEGKLLDGRYPLERLIGPKGRSAFFQTRSEAGQPAVARVIESLNDEDEILARWSLVSGMTEPHLLRILTCGKTVLDGTHLVYALLEATDADLSEILRERPLTPDETREVAASVITALEALHGRGLVHEHVEPESVLARGETVVLRSDCVREAPEGAAGETARRRDTHDVAMLVGYALTGRRDGAAQVRLPRPFEDLVRQGMSGVWGLKEMGTAVRPVAAVTSAPPSGVPAPVSAGARVPASAASAASSLPASGGQQASAGTRVATPSRAPEGIRLAATAAAPARAATPVSGAPALTNGRAAAAARPAPQPTSVRTPVAAAPVRAAAESYSPRAVAESLRQQDAEPAVTRPSGMRERSLLEPEARKQPGPAVWAGGATAAVLLGGALLWHARSGTQPAPPPAAASATSNDAAAAPATTTAVAGRPVGQPVKPSAAITKGRGPGAKPRAVPPVATAAAPATAPAAAGTGAVGATGLLERGGGPPGAQWRVVSYTYNREDQAQGKAAQIAGAHPELKPQVFTPSGHAPYLVTVGGWMTVAEATAERDRARNAGLPRDSYTQNYRGH